VHPTGAHFTEGHNGLPKKLRVSGPQFWDRAFGQLVGWAQQAESDIRAGVEVEPITLHQLVFGGVLPHSGAALVQACLEYGT